MSISLVEYKISVELTKLKHYVIANDGYSYKQLEGVREAFSLLTKLDLPYPYRTDIAECKKNCSELITYLEGKHSRDCPEYLRLLQNFLSTYFSYIDRRGSGVERVTWLESGINSFLRQFGSLSKEDLDDNILLSLLTILKNDIKNIYEKTFSTNMQKSVSNYDDFKILLENLELSYEGVRF